MVRAKSSGVTLTTQVDPVPLINESRSATCCLGFDRSFPVSVVRSWPGSHATGPVGFAAVFLADGEALDEGLAEALVLVEFLVLVDVLALLEVCAEALADGLGEAEGSAE